MGSSVKRVGRSFEKLGSGAFNAITFGLFESPDPPPIPAVPKEIDANSEFAGEVSVEDRRRIQRLRLKQAQAQGRQGTILGGASATPGNIANSSTLLGE